jgi:lysophospholipase
MVKEFFEKTTDDVELYGKINKAENQKAVAVIVHGLCEHQGRYDYVTNYLVNNGITVYRFDHRGHGRSKGERVYYDSYEVMISDVDMFVQMAINENPSSPVYMLGHSMGGYAAACYGTKYSGKLSGLILTGAWTRDYNGIAGNVPEGIDPMTYVDNELGDGVCSDPEVVSAYVNDPFVEKKISMGLLYACKKGHKWLKDNADKFTDPVMIMHGANDGLVSEEDSRAFFSEIGSADKSLFIYSKLYHEILNEPCKDKILGHIMEWIDERN